MVTVEDLTANELRPGIWQVIAKMTNGTICRGYGAAYNDALIDMMRANRDYAFNWDIFK